MYDAAITPAAGEVSAPPPARVNKSDVAGQPNDSPVTLQAAGAGNFGVSPAGQPAGHQMAFYEVMATTHPADVHAHFPAAEPGVQRPAPELVASRGDSTLGRSAEITANGAFPGPSRLGVPSQVTGDGGGRDAGKSGGVGRVMGNISKEEIAKGGDSRNGSGRGGQTGSVAGDGSESGAGKSGVGGQGMVARDVGREQVRLAVGDGASAAGHEAAMVGGSASVAGSAGRHGPAGNPAHAPADGPAHNTPDGAPVTIGGPAHAPAGGPAGSPAHGDVFAETPEPFDAYRAATISSISFTS